MEDKEASLVQLAVTKKSKVRMSADQGRKDDQDILSADTNAPGVNLPEINGIDVNSSQDPLLQQNKERLIDSSKIHPFPQFEAPVLRHKTQFQNGELEIQQTINQQQQAYGSQRLDASRIAEKRKENDIMKFSNLKTGKEYLEAIRFSIPLHDIFTVVDSCHFNYDEQYCPVLLKLGKDYDKHLKEKDEEAKFCYVHRYQLQIWKKGGYKIYEREIRTDAEFKKPISNWNIFGDVFVFQELNNSEVCLVKCYPDKNCEFYKFILPPEIQIHDKNEHKNNLPNRLIGYWNSNILFAVDNKIYNFNVAKDMQDYNPQTQATENMIPVSINQLRFTNNSDGYYPVQFTSVEKDTTCLVVANKTTNYATFLKVHKIDNNDIHFNSMGLTRAEQNVVHIETCSKAKIEHFISVMYKNSKGQPYQAGMSLLSDGTLHFYVDFGHLVPSSKQFSAKSQDGNSYMLAKRKIIQIGTDLEKFYFRTAPYQINGKEQNEYFQCSIEWRQRLGFNSSNQLKCPQEQDIKNKFEYLLHRRICNHFAIFKTYMNFSTFFIIAYRDRLIIFDLTNEPADFCVDQIGVSEQVINMSMVKEPKDFAYNVLITTKNNELIVIDEKRNKTKHSLFSQERILLVQSDRYCQKAVFYLTKTIKSKKKPVFYIRRGSNVFKNYDQKQEEQEEAIINLYVCTASGKPQLLLTSAEGANLNEKTHFVVYAQNCEFVDKMGRVQNKDCQAVKLLIDTPSEVKSSQIFTLEDVDDGFRLVKDENEIMIDEYDTGKLIGVVSACSSDFGKMNGSIARITTDSITVYDNDFQFKIAFLNTSVLKMLQIDDFYMYCMLKASDKKLMVKRKGKEEVKAVGIFPRKRVSGVFVFDMQRMIKDSQIELYQLSKAIAGVNTHVDYSATLQRISFVENYSRIQMQPFSHRNTINFLGMQPKNHYLIWREKNGFFTALQNTGELHTWSMLTGSHLFESPDPKLAENLKGFSVYSSSDKDNSYKRAHYNSSNSTVQLLYRTKPLRLKTLIQNESHMTFFQKLGKNKSKEVSDETIFTKTEGSQNVQISFEIEYGVYEFKVLELKMHQDFLNDNTCEALVEKEQVCELFNFEFDLSIKPADERFSEREMDGRLQLVLSQDTRKLMVIIDNNIFCIYNRNEPSKGNKIEWQPDKERQFKKFPNLLQANMKTNFLFDPTFTYFINCDYDKGCFVVVETTGKHYKDIPPDLIGLNSQEDGKKSAETVILKARNMFFKSESIIEYISTAGLWVMLNIHDENKEVGQMRVKRYSQIKNWQDRDAVQDHIMLNPVVYKQNDVFKRILRQGQWSEINLERAKYSEIMDQANQHPRYQKTDWYQRQLLSSIYRVEHDQDYDNLDSYFQAEATFTILDWLILAEVLNNMKVKIENVDHNQRLQLTQNIFPNRQTALHIFVNNCFRSEDSGSVLNNQDVVLGLFETAQKGYVTFGDFKQNIAFEIPIIEDFNGRTPFDISLAIQEKHKLSSLFTDNGYDSSKYDQKRHYKISTTMAGILFACTKDYKFLHSAHLISDAIIKAIEHEVPGIGEYIEGRLKSPSHLPNLNQKPILKKVQYKFLSLNEEGQRKFQAYGVSTMKVFSGKNEIQKTMFAEQGPTKCMEMFQLDIPYIHLHTNVQGIRFINALNNTKEVNLFLLPSIQAIINYHWNSWTVKSYLWGCLIIPYIIQLSCFIVWSNVTLKFEVEKAQEYHDDLENTLAVISFWFLTIELRQMTRKGFVYFKNHWNLIESLPMILILVNIFRHKKEGENVYYDKTFWNVQAIAALTMWGKFLYFLRSFDATGYLIRSLAEVINDMLVFLFVLGIVVLGYADAFSSMNKAQPLEEPQYGTFIEGQNYFHAIWYSYNTLLGAWDVNQMSPLATILFVSATILEVIVMLNLLIAIVSATFERVTASSVQYSFKEKVSLINDIYDSVKFGSSLGVIKGAKTELMFLVREDEKNKEAIPDDEGENDDMSTDDKVSLIVEELKNLKTQMGQDKEEFRNFLQEEAMHLSKAQAAMRAQNTTPDRTIDRKKTVAATIGLDNIVSVFK